MSRGGRGGGMNRLRGGHALPFQLDPELEAVAGQNGFDEDAKTEKESVELFPPVDLATSRPITEEERKLVQIYRRQQARRRAGPFWTGTAEDWASTKANKKGDPGRGHDPFEDAPTYGHRIAKREFRLRPLRNVKLYKQFFPKELHDVLGMAGEGDQGDIQGVQKSRKLGIAKTVTDKLAKFDNDNDDVNADAEEDEDAIGGDEDEEGEADLELQDDDFEEDEDDDADNDYNAEHYFDGGEEDIEEMDGGEHGEDY